MNRRIILLNTITASVQVVIVGLTYFFLYKLLISKIGMQKIGIWSLVLSTISVANISNMGLSSSIVKFVAKYHAREEYKTLVDLIKTAFTSIAIFLGAICIVSYPLMNYILKFFIPINSIDEAKIILPYALVSLWLASISSILLSGIDGLQQTYLRSIVLSGSNVLFFVLSFLLVDRYQLLGLAYAQLIQYALIIIIAFMILRYHLNIPLTVTLKWDKKLFKEMLSYGVNFQLISISTMLYDPVTKLLLSKFEGLPSVGFYEMASRMVVQVRALLVNANNALVPTIAYMYENDMQSVKAMYIRSFRYLFYLALPLFATLTAFTPIISELWIGHYEREFVLFSIMLNVGWFINILNAPSYFVYMGVGDLKWSLISHLAISLLNGFLGYLFGISIGGDGVVIGWIIALIAGSLIVPITYHSSNRISLKELFPGGNTLFILTLLLYSSLSIFFYNTYRWRINFEYAFMINILMCVSVVVPVMCTNSLGIELLKIIKNQLQEGRASDAVN